MGEACATRRFTITTGAPSLSTICHHAFSSIDIATILIATSTTARFALRRRLVCHLEAKGNAAFSSGDFASATRHFTDAIALSPTNHILYSNRSAAYASLQKYDEALEDAEKTVELKSDWAKGYNRLGAALIGLKKYDGAISAYKKGLETDPKTTPF